APARSMCHSRQSAMRRSVVIDGCLFPLILGATVSRRSNRCSKRAPGFGAAKCCEQGSVDGRLDPETEAGVWPVHAPLASIAGRMRLAPLGRHAKAKPNASGIR